jgi:hypothetical protein
MAQVIHDVNRAIRALEKLLPQEGHGPDWGGISSDLEVALNILKRELQRREKILAECEAAGKAIDVETCEIIHTYADDLDPYNLGCESYQSGRNLFVWSADSDGWVWEGDLPEAKQRALLARIERERAAKEVRP